MARPKTGTKTGWVWYVADQLMRELGRPPTRAEIVADRRLVRLNKRIVSLQFEAWQLEIGAATPTSSRAGRV